MENLKTNFNHFCCHTQKHLQVYVCYRRIGYIILCNHCSDFPVNFSACAHAYNIYHVFCVYNCGRSGMVNWWKHDASHYTDNVLNVSMFESAVSLDCLTSSRSAIWKHGMSVRALFNPASPIRFQGLVYRPQSQRFHLLACNYSFTWEANLTNQNMINDLRSADVSFFSLGALEVSLGKTFFKYSLTVIRD